MPPGVRSRDACFLDLSSLALFAHRGISSYRKRLRGCGCGDAVEPEIALAPLFNDGVWDISWPGKSLLWDLGVGTLLVCWTGL